jgi:ligand-binding sensor domain-containing protein
MKMYDGRIFVINRQTDCIIDPLANVSGHEDYRVDYFFNPHVISTGDVLVSYGNNGFYKFHLDRTGLKGDLVNTEGLIVKSVAEGYHNDLWIGTNKGVHRMNPSNMALESKGFLTDEDVTQLTSNGYNIYAGTTSGKIIQFSYGDEPQLVYDWGHPITGIFVDSHGLLWFSDNEDGCMRLNRETGNIKRFTQRTMVPEFTSRGAEFSEALGVVWARMNHGGYGYYNRENDEIEYFHNDPSNPWNLSNTVNARLEMNDGVVWESTIRRGFEKLEILKNNIPRTLLVPGAENTMENETRALYYDAQQQLLLIGNKNGQLFLFDKFGNKTILTHDSNGKPFARFYGISKDSKGNYWLCDKDNGLYKMSPNPNGGYTIINFCHQDGDQWSLSSNSVYQAVEDKQGNIWAATYGGGINVLVKDKEGHYKAYNQYNKLKRYPRKTFQRVRTVALDKEGKVWAGSTDGILMMSLKRGNFEIEHLENPEHIENGLASTDIVYLATDKQGTMWVGTNGGGLSRATEKDANGVWQFENFGSQQGLPSEEIRSFTFDDKGNVWIATDHILSSLDTKKNIFTTFSNLDGVDDTNCSEGAAVALPNGHILFGTLNGYYEIDRNKLITKTGSLLKLRITDFFLDDELQTPRLNNNFSYYVPESKRVVLPGHNNKFAFRFASLNYQFQHRIHYQYRLEGYDVDWRNAGKDRMAIYDDVPAGTYRFQVKAFLLESPENYDMRTMEVVIPPYFFLSPAAVWIYLILLCVLGIGGLWWYQERIRRLLGKDVPNFMDLLDDEEKEETVSAVTNEETDEYEIME